MAMMPVGPIVDWNQSGGWDANPYQESRALTFNCIAKHSQKCQEFTVQMLYFTIFWSLIIYFKNYLHKLQQTNRQSKEWAEDPIPTIYSSGVSKSPLLISSIMSWGGLPSTVHPTDWQVPRISLMVPLSSRDMDLGLIARAMVTISSNDRFPLCLIFLTFLRSLGGSFRALMINDAAEGTTEMVACLFWIVSWTVIFRPFQSLVALAMSSPTFLGDCGENRANELVVRY